MPLHDNVIDIVGAVARFVLNSVGVDREKYRYHAMTLHKQIRRQAMPAHKIIDSTTIAKATHE
jgi:hypothetical protein